VNIIEAKRNVNALRGEGILSTAEKAKAIAEAGFAVFPVKADKTPYASDGLKSASLDPWFVFETFEKFPKALIAIHCGMSNIVVLDIDYKEDANGNPTVDGYDSLDRAWLEIPSSFSYPSVSGLGKHIMYAAPEGKNLAPKAGYRKMAGVDRRSGESYVLYPGEDVPDRSALNAAPEWLCDETTVRSADRFEGAVSDWYETLEPGEPSVLVRAAMDRATSLFESRGNDLTHSDIVERQHEAVRLGSEGHAGVPQLLALLEELALNRTGDHSRNPDEYIFEFQEALSSGIEKHGAAIDLRAEIPAYSLAMVPKGVPDRLLVGDAGDKEVFRALLAALLEATDDDLVVLSVLWNSPRTRDLSREWGLLFVNERIKSARSKPEPIRENPTLPTPEPKKEVAKVEENPSGGFLTADEAELVKNNETFIDAYCAASRDAKGFERADYEVPAAWTILSMAMGRKVFIPSAKSLGVNLWVLVLGYSTTGKSTEDRLLTSALDLMFTGDSEMFYNVGATSSPAGVHESLLVRDNLPSIVQDDEAANFFRELRNPGGYLMGIQQLHADWYEGAVKPQNKIRLPKELRGKSAKTSFNVHMSGTPDNTLDLLDMSMFESGYLARYNWAWGAPPVDPDRKYQMRLGDRKDESTPESFYSLVADVKDAGGVVGSEMVSMSASSDVQDRLNKAYRDFDKFAQASKRYKQFGMAIDRLGSETIWKCAALLAVYSGRTEIGMRDAVTAIHYATAWLHTLIKVAEAISESPYSRDLEEMEKFIRSEGGKVSRELFLHHFRGRVVRSQREIDDRLGYLIESGRVNRVEKDSKIVYVLNGSND
jgi:hypothetical protein